MNNGNFIIGVFDSGVGGLAIANAVQEALPNAKVILREDKANLPYGNKPPEALLSLVEPILNELVDLGCQVIVIACNTVTTTIISELRSRLKVPLIGMEPMVKPAAEQTASGIIAVCATPGTLASQRYHWLKQTYAPNIKVLEPDCSDWALMIETDRLDQQKIKQNIDQVINDGADVIVLGCTHYHWIEETINDLAKGRAKIIQPTEPVVKQLKTVLSQLP